MSGSLWSRSPPQRPHTPRRWAGWRKSRQKPPEKSPAAGWLTGQRSGGSAKKARSVQEASKPHAELIRARRAARMMRSLRCCHSVPRPHRTKHAA
jgi:hypothetical protein